MRRLGTSHSITRHPRIGACGPVSEGVHACLSLSLENVKPRGEVRGDTCGAAVTLTLLTALIHGPSAGDDTLADGGGGGRG